MPVFSADFSEAVERRLIPIDWYRVRIDTVEVTSSKRGDAMLKVLLKVTEGPYDDQPLFTNWMLVGRGAGITKSALRAFLGDTVDDPGYQFSTEELVGAEALARVTQKVWAEEDEGDGELQNRVSRFKPLEIGAGDLSTKLFK